MVRITTVVSIISDIVRPTLFNAPAPVLTSYIAGELLFTKLHSSLLMSLKTPHILC